MVVVFEGRWVGWFYSNSCFYYLLLLVPLFFFASLCSWSIVLVRILFFFLAWRSFFFIMRDRFFVLVNSNYYYFVSILCATTYAYGRLIILLLTAPVSYAFASLSIARRSSPFGRVAFGGVNMACVLRDAAWHACTGGGKMKLTWHHVSSLAE